MSTINISSVSKKYLIWWCQENGVESDGTKRTILKRIFKSPYIKTKCLMDLESIQSEDMAAPNYNLQLPQVGVEGKAIKDGKICVEGIDDYNEPQRTGRTEDKAKVTENIKLYAISKGDEMELKQGKEQCKAKNVKDSTKISNEMKEQGKGNDENAEGIANNEMSEETNNNNAKMNKKSKNEFKTLEKKRNDMELQLEILRKQQQILELENEMQMLKLRANKGNETGASNFGVPFETLKEFIPSYDGEDQVDIWLTQLQNVKDCYKLEDNIVRALICSKMKGKAQEWLHLNSSYLIGPVDDLILAISQVFKNNVSKLAIRQRLQNRIWQGGEKFTTYYNEKLNLANSIKLEDDEFLEYLINGIPDVNLRNTARLRSFISKSEMLQAFNNVELSVPATTKRSRDTNGTPIQEMKCFNCNSKGHIASVCRKPKRESGSCFACGEVGHLAKDCSLYKKTKMEAEENEYNVS